jgi:hypothetical protein
MNVPYQGGLKFLLDSNLFLSEAYGRASWLKLDALDSRVDRLESDLLTLRNDFTTFHELLHSLDWSAICERYWAEYYLKLLWQAHLLHVEERRLEEFQGIASTDVVRACRLLAGEVYRAFTGKIASLRQQLRFVRFLRAILLRFAATAYLFRNKITLQRRFYLAHGAHPVEKQPA